MPPSQELIVVGDAKSPTAIFLREDEKNRGVQMSTECRDDIFETLAERYEWHKKQIIIPAFYCYDQPSKTWDSYAIVTDSRKAELIWLGTETQAELVRDYGVGLYRSTADYIAQTKADISFLETLKIEHEIQSKIDAAAKAEPDDQRNLLKQLKPLKQRERFLDGLIEELADFTQREAHKLHH